MFILVHQSHLYGSANYVFVVLHKGQLLHSMFQHFRDNVEWDEEQQLEAQKKVQLNSKTRVSSEKSGLCLLIHAFLYMYNCQ